MKLICVISKYEAGLSGEHFMSIFGHIFCFFCLLNPLRWIFIIQFSTYHTFALVLKDRTSWGICPHWVQIAFGENNQLKTTVSTLLYFLPTFYFFVIFYFFFHNYNFELGFFFWKMQLFFNRFFQKFQPVIQVNDWKSQSQTFITSSSCISTATIEKNFDYS